MTAATAGGSTHALVIGSGVAGLLASQVLDKYFDRITLVERDYHEFSLYPRPGVPHGLHIHVLMARGLEIMEQLFPGLTKELETAGAVVGDLGADLAILLPTGWMPRFTSGYSGRACSRQLLESCMRRRIADQPRTRIAIGKRVVGLIRDASGNGICGVRLDSADGPEELFADFVVDASGRTSSASRWLLELGYPPTPKTIVRSSIVYCSRRYQRPTDRSHSWRGLVVMARPPQLPRYGLLYPEEEGHWGVALAGASPDTPPNDEIGFLEFAHRLASPLLYEAIRTAKPISPIVQYRKTENHLRHYERLDRWPDRFIVLGDAVCASNPIYGQGMTLAALAAVTLQHCLENFISKQGLAGVARRFQRELARVNQIPWLIASSEDLRYPNASARPHIFLTGLANWYVDRFMAAAPSSLTASRALIDTVNLLDPYALFRPRAVSSVLIGSLNFFKNRDMQASNRSHDL
jgi:2-polyprenyl-6-methoxyphenol hydroxylase-like FAD-dependent oxidoreductase